MSNPDSRAATNWGGIVRNIRNGKSILFLGPNITMNYGDAQREANFLHTLAERHPNVISQFSADGFLVFAQGKRKGMYLHEVEPFYRQDFRNDLLELLSEIPFHIIINITPDLAINKVFDAKKFDYLSRVYDKTKTALEVPTSEKPIIYHLLGSVNQLDSIILTHQDLFAYLKSLYIDDPLPDSLQNGLRSAENVIFLGFDFSKWYFQLMLHLLHISDEKENTTTNENSHLSAPYDSLFNVQVANEEMGDFVKTLHAQFKPSELRQPVENTQKQIRKYLYPKIMQLLSKAFIVGEFEAFCMLNFEAVYETFTDGQNKTARILALIDYIKAYNAEDELLTALQEENPNQYQNLGPYYED